MPSTKEPRDKTIEGFIRRACRDLDGKFDRAAVERILQGVLCDDDDGGLTLHESVAQLWNSDQHDTKVSRWVEQYEQQNWPDLCRTMYVEFEKLEIERFDESVQAAYLLGIAVGRRLGASPLTGAPAR